MRGADRARRREPASTLAGSGVRARVPWRRFSAATSREVLAGPILGGSTMWGGCDGRATRGGLAALVALAVAAPAQAAYHGTNGAIVFTSTRTGTPHVFRLDPSGTETDLSVASGLGTATQPAWSPDGTKVALVHAGGIWVMNPDGRHARLLTGTYTNESDPAWSPDGTRIAFVDATSANPDIYVMSASGKGRTPLTQTALIEHGLSWSPDGSRIAFDGHTTSSPANTQICTLDVRTGALTNVS